MRRAKGHMQQLGKNHWKCIVTLKGEYTKQGNQKRRTENMRGLRTDAESHLAIKLLRYDDRSHSSGITIIGYFDTVFPPDKKRTSKRPRTKDTCRRSRS